MKATIQDRVNTLEEAIKRVLYIQQQTQIEIQELKQEMEEFKNEMRAFKDEMKLFKDEMVEYKNWGKGMIKSLEKTIQEMKKKWGELSNRLGTLVEDIFAPSISMCIQKHFGIRPDVVDKNKEVEKEGDNLEIDILALNREKKKAFVVEVKAKPDKKEYIEDFEEKIR